MPALLRAVFLRLFCLSCLSHISYSMRARAAAPHLQAPRHQPPATLTVPNVYGLCRALVHNHLTVGHSYRRSTKYCKRWA